MATTKQRLKVFGIDTFLRNVHGQVRAIAACSSQKEFADLLHTTLHFVRGYGAETGNEEELRIALSNPGKVFYSATNRVGEGFKEVPDET
jgi:hypothetical protein